MEGLFANLYLVIQDKIKGLTHSNKPLIRFIAEDTGQLSDEVPAVTFPCILVNMDDARFTDLSENVQMGVVNIRLILVMEVYSSSSSITPQKPKEKALSYMDIESRLHKALQAWSPSDQDVPVQEDGQQPEGWEDIFGSLDRVEAKTNKQRDDLKVREITYSLGFEDYSCYDPGAYVPVTPDITTEFEIDTGDPEDE